MEKEKKKTLSWFGALMMVTGFIIATAPIWVGILLHRPEPSYGEGDGPFLLFGGGLAIVGLMKWLN